MIWEPTEANMLWESIPLGCLMRIIFRSIAYHSTLTEQALQYITRLSIHFLQIMTLKIFLSVHKRSCLQMMTQIGFTSRPVLPGNAPAQSYRDFCNFVLAILSFFS